MNPLKTPHLQTLLFGPPFDEKILVEKTSCLVPDPSVSSIYGLHTSSVPHLTDTWMRSRLPNAGLSCRSKKIPLKSFLIGHIAGHQLSRMLQYTLMLLKLFSQNHSDGSLWWTCKHIGMWRLGPAMGRLPVQLLYFPVWLPALILSSGRAALNPSIVYVTAALLQICVLGNVTSKYITIVLSIQDWSVFGHKRDIRHNKNVISVLIWRGVNCAMLKMTSNIGPKNVSLQLTLASTKSVTLYV